jgi:hypothetical protein
MDSDAGSILDIVIACRRLKRFVEGRSREDLDGDDWRILNLGKRRRGRPVRRLTEPMVSVP